MIVGDPVSGHSTFARVKVPIEILPRFVAVGERDTFVPLEDVIADNLDSLFQGMEIVDYAVFRVSRDADLVVSDEAEDLMRAVEDELRRRRFGEVVRVEVGAGMSDALLGELMAALDVDEAGIYPIDGRLDLTGLWQLVKLPGHAKLRDEPWAAPIHPRFRAEDGRPDVMSAMRKGDILVHHPYDSFTSSVGRFVEQAVADPNVLAIKQTVYRTSDDSPLVPALIRAAEQGKQAVCLVELQARFDERTNIVWAKALEQAGVHVVYGHPALKTHAKCVLVVRREGDRRPQLRAHRNGQLPLDDGPPLHGLRPLHDGSRPRPGRRRAVQLPDRLRTTVELPQGPRRTDPPARRDPRADRRRRSRRIPSSRPDGS